MKDQKMTTKQAILITVVFIAVLGFILLLILTPAATLVPAAFIVFCLLNALKIFR